MLHAALAEAPSRSAPVGARYGAAASRCGLWLLVVLTLACVGSVPWALARVGTTEQGSARSRRYEAADLGMGLLPPRWWPLAPDDRARIDRAAQDGRTVPTRWLGTDRLGRDVLARCLLGGAVSLVVGTAAATIAVVIGTFYGMVAAVAGGRVDGIMMRTVDVLYGLPTILIVVLLAVAVDGVLARVGTDLASWQMQLLNGGTLLVAIGAVSWLTMARVIRGQVLSLRAQPFMEACRAIGVPARRQFFRHLLPNLVGPIVVYATLAVPAAILSESFLSFLGIGIREPLPSWGNLAADGLAELNPVRSRWWLLLWPCLLIATTLLSLNFIGEGLRERFDPRGRRS
ncbi:MAG: ABC transporter permease [Phycisphaerales bacterium]|nr:ABC transporter permease [Phycisphaerales bacterium]